MGGSIIIGLVESVDEVARNHQRGVAALVLLVDRRALLEQQLHHLHVAKAARVHQRGLAALVLLVDRSALVEQQLHPLRVALDARAHQRGPADQLHHLRVATGGKGRATEERDHVAIDARQHQRGVAALVLLANRRAPVEQQLHHLRVALLARRHQRGPAALVLLVDWRAIIEQLLHQLRVAGADRVVKWAHCALERMRRRVSEEHPVAGLLRSLVVAPVPLSPARSGSACHRGRENGLRSPEYVTWLST
eukprot:scaffold68443_cov61-Phaeocystis_antarctica.AAC.4